jgi:hypothetical protein
MRRVLVFLAAAWLLCAQTAKPPAASIRGVVKDAATGAPLPDFNVRVIRMQPMEGVGLASMSSSTDEEGRYTIDNVPAGALLITVSFAKLRPLSRAVQLGAGQDMTQDFLIPGSPVLSGRVLGQDKEPVVDAFVWVIQSDYLMGFLRHSAIGPQVTGEDGTFTFDTGLEAERAYYVVVDRPPPEPAPTDPRELIETPTYYGDATSLDAATPLVLRPGEHREQVEIGIRKSVSYCVEGKTEVSGKPASLGFAIHELALAGTQLARLNAYSAEDGTFRICNLTPGQYRLSTNNPSRGEAEFAIANSDVHHVQLAVETATLHLDLAWDGDPPPIPKSTLPVLSASMRVVLVGDRYVVTDQSGRVWELSAAEAGRSFASSQADRIAVNLTGLRNGLSVLTSEAAPYDGPFRWGPGRDDTAAAAIPAGDYLVGFSPPSGSYVKRMTYNGVTFTDRLLHLAPGASGTLRIVASQDAGTLSYKVADADGNPVPNATVLLIPEGLPNLLQQASADQNGACTSRTLAPGKYRALALTRPFRLIPEDMDKLVLALSKAKPIELDAKTTLQVNLQPVSID